MLYPVWIDQKATRPKHSNWGLTALQWLKVLPFIKCTFRELIYGGSKNSCILEAAAAEGWKRSSEK